MNIIVENEEILDISASLERDFLKGDKGDKGIQGDKGDKGDTGDVGPSNSLVIGTVEKGEEASASITGTSPNQTLNLILPKGDKGDTGEKGPQGIQGVQGIKGDTGPQGEQGIQGEQGVAGKDGYTPVKGVDYWNEEDKEEIKSFVDISVQDLENVLQDILTAIQEGGTTSYTIEQIEQIIVSYFENKTVEEVEA